MAVLTGAELELASRLASRGGVAVTWRKAHIRGALQSIEDAMVSTSNVGNRSVRAHVSQAIEAVAAGVFSAGQKDDLFVIWSQLNARRGGIL